jgi:signal peptidase I
MGSRTSPSDLGGPAASERSQTRGDATRRAATLRARLRGPWRVVVSEASMEPTIEPGDWLLVDPTTARWPRRGAIVVFREPDSDLLAIKRLAAGPGERVDLDEGHLVLGADEAWLLSDATDAALLASGAGQPIDSRRYGPVPVDALVGRAWFRYGPLSRIGRIARRPAILDR